MASWKIEHDRPNCIGCGACAAVNPDNWSMSTEDGKSTLSGSTEVKDGDEVVRQELIVGKLDGLKDAAEACPVNVIHITDLTANKKLL